MSSQIEEVNKIIEQMVAEKTLSLEGLKSVDILKQKLVDAEAKIEELTRRVEVKDNIVKSRDTDIYTLKSKITGLENQVQTWVTREAELLAREAARYACEKTAAVNEAQAVAYKYALDTVFKPAIMRETVWSNTNKAVPVTTNGYTTTYNESSSESINRETKSE